MHKVLVAEIHKESIIINAFVDLDTENPRLIGRGISYLKIPNEDVKTGFKLALKGLENDIGPLSSLKEIPLYATSSLPTVNRMEVNEPYILKDKIKPATEAIGHAAQLIYEEVGEVLVLDVSSISTNVCSLTSDTLPQQSMEEELSVISNPMPLVKLIGVKRIGELYGQEWKKLIKIRPESPEEILFSTELTTAAIAFALKRHSTGLGNQKSRDLRNIRWIVGTGAGLTQLPNALEIFRKSVENIDQTLFPKEGKTILLDKDGVMLSLGMLAATYRKASWQLMRESFGVEN